ncbi:hypothetical protein FANTH_11251 [Fusarium anthophilum]|uniref:Alpha/beta hydrolase fold-3 domain-containing protein n=1 Tax=Fusarium anthophilum TaxID=48485 RepID=A0A8H4YYI8_9HYPO|nr:hypothetical protein FANTH_11251 [Fusarium anthophilum]
MSSVKCASFYEFESSYKTVSNCEIKASIFVPKKISKETLPILVHFHGGGLVMGDKNYFPWLVQLAEKHEAVIVSPNYRLIPEATVSDVLQDLESFWAWLHNYLPSQVSMNFGNVRLDIQKIVVAGESAGISVAISQYGTMLFNHDFMIKRSPKEEAEIVPELLVDEHLRSMKAGAVRTSSVGDEALRLSAAFVQHGRYDGFLGGNPCIFLEEAEKHAINVPPIWIIQGTEDSMALVESSQALVDRLRQHTPTTKVCFSLESGGHGFDLEATLGTEDLANLRAWRPISLLSCLGKGLERLVARRLAWAYIHHRVLHPQQAGALPKRYVMDLVTALVHDIGEAFARKKVATLVTMDIQGGFDTILRNTMILRLWEQGWPEHLA